MSRDASVSKTDSDHNENDFDWFFIKGRYVIEKHRMGLLLNF